MNNLFKSERKDIFYLEKMLFLWTYYIKCVTVFTKILKILLHNCHDLLSPVRSQQHYNCQHLSWLPPAHIQSPGYSPSLESVFHNPHLGHNGRSYVGHLGFPFFLVDCGLHCKGPFLSRHSSHPSLSRISRRSQASHPAWDQFRLFGLGGLLLSPASLYLCPATGTSTEDSTLAHCTAGVAREAAHPAGTTLVTCPLPVTLTSHLPGWTHFGAFLLKMMLCKQPLSSKVKATFLQRFSSVFLFHSSSVLFLQNSYLLPVRTLTCSLTLPYLTCTYLFVRRGVSSIISSIHYLQFACKADC